MNQLKVRGLISLLLLVSFIIEGFTGFGLYLAPSGRIARDSDWSFIGFDRVRLESMHTIWGFIMIGLIIIHLSLNYKLFISELRALFK